MNYPKISIITPSYNQSDYIEQTIKSVLDQNYPNLEYIIMDGGSTDGTVKILEKYSNRLTHWESSKDKGMYDALYKGIELSTGDIIGWINSDDLYLPNSFFTVAELFSTFKNIDWIEGANSHLDEKGRIVSVYQPFYLTKYDFISRFIKPIQQESTFFTRKLWIKSGKPLNTKSQLAGDFQLWCSFFKVADLYISTSPLGCFRYRSSNQKSLTYKKEYELEVKEILRHNRKDKHSKVQLFYRIMTSLYIFRLLSLVKLDIVIKQILFKTPKLIKFNRNNQCFYLS